MIFQMSPNKAEITVNTPLEHLIAMYPSFNSSELALKAAIIAEDNARRTEIHYYRVKMGDLLQLAEYWESQGR